MWLEPTGVFSKLELPLNYNEGMLLYIAIASVCVSKGGMGRGVFKQWTGLLHGMVESFIVGLLFIDA